MSTLDDKYQNQLILFSDVKLHLKKKTIFFAAVATATFFLTFGAYLVQEPVYVAKATFKEAGVKSDQSATSLLKNLFLAAPTSDEGGAQAILMMKSRFLLEKVIQELGLQATLLKPAKAQRITHRIKENIQYIAKKSLPDVVTPCIEVIYTPFEIAHDFYLEPLDETSYKLTDVYTKESIDASFGEIVYLSNACMRVPKGQYPKMAVLQIKPMEDVVKRLLKKLKIKGKKEEGSILDLSFEHRDRRLGALFLNTLMADYKEYLAQDSERVSHEQLKYLSKRQEEIALNLEDAFEHHASYLKKQLDERGYISIQDEIQVKEGLKKDLDAEIDRIDNKLNALQHMSVDHPNSLVEDGKIERLCERLNAMLEEEQTYLASRLKWQDSEIRDVSAIKAPYLPKSQVGHFSYQNLTSILDEKVRKPLSELHHFKQLDAQVKELLEEINQGRSLDQKSMKEVTKLAKLDDNLELTGEHLKRLESLLELKIDTLNQRLFKPNKQALEYDSMNLEIAKNLFLDYTRQLDEVHLKMKQLEFCLEQIHHDTFEASSLPSFLSDAVTIEAMAQAAKLHKQLRDSHYYSSKDHDRMDKSLKKEKEALFHHLKHVKSLIELEKGLCLEKIGALHDVMLKLLHQDRTLIQRQLKEAIQAKTVSLENSKKMVKERLQKLHENMSDIPQKWLKEQTLELKKNLNISMMEAMTQLVESKNVDVHLTQVESRAIDLAAIPLKPSEKNPLLIAICFSILLTFLSCGMSLLRQIFKGFPISLEGLEMRGRYCVHELEGKALSNQKEPLNKKSLEGLRKLAAFIVTAPSSKLIGITLNHNMDYAKSLAQLLTLSGKKVLLVPFEAFLQKDYQWTFLKESEDVLKEEPLEMWIEKKFTDHGVELLLTPQVLAKIHEAKASYDVIAFITQESALSSLAQRMLNLVDQMIVTLEEESLHELYPYLKWEDEKDYASVCYVRLSAKH